MIDKYLMNRIRSRMSNGKKVDYHLVDSLLENYELIAKQNTELHKELANLKGDRVFVVNGEEK